MEEHRNARSSMPRAERPPVACDWPVAQDIGEQTELGVLYVRSLIRVQRRAALITCASLAAVVSGLPALLAGCPSLAATTVLGMPVPWLLLGGCVHPIWAVVGAWQVGWAEHTERGFTDFVERA